MYCETPWGNPQKTKTDTGGGIMSQKEIEVLVDSWFEEMDKNPKNLPPDIHEKAKANKKKKFAKA